MNYEKYTYLLYCLVFYFQNIGNKIFIPEKNVFWKIIDIENINMRQNTYTIEIAENDSFIANGMLVKTKIVK